MWVSMNDCKFKVVETGEFTSLITYDGKGTFTRYARDSKGKILKDINGNWIIETIKGHIEIIVDYTILR